MIATGGNSGIADAVALDLAQAGADVAINYVAHPEAANEIALKIEGIEPAAVQMPSSRMMGGVEHVVALGFHDIVVNGRAFREAL